MNISLAEHLIYISLILILICATVTDLRERLIYDRFVLIGLAFALGIHLYSRHYSWTEYILTSLGAFFALALIAILTKGSAIGGGDIKLFAMIGFATGLEDFILIFMVSHVVAAIFILVVKLFRSDAVRKGTEFPFAPFILIGVLLTYAFYWI
ncbi:leader peptide processing enzyme [Desmospora sp. 8437]|nr:leader peptide processing enzyme [Desmospora sp. 8437]